MNQKRKFREFISLIVIVCIQSCASVFSPAETQIRDASWSTRKVATGVVWKYHHFEKLFDSKESVTVLDIDLDRVGARVEYVDSGFFKTSTRAAEVGAVAAVNGSFFNTKTGGSVVFLKKDDVVITAPDNNPGAYRDNVGFVIDEVGNVSIIARPPQGWMTLEDIPTILSSGPLLIADGTPVPQVQEKFNTNRHPRTAVGLTKKNHLIAVIVDGRSAEAYGMTTEELASLLFALGCTDAMNLDGGGSSTAWVRSQPFNGVVNFPSDNKRFDHEGERRVSNCIVFLVK